MNKSERNRQSYMKAGIKDAADRAALKAKESQNDSPAQPPQSLIKLPRNGIILSHTILTHPLQIGGSQQEYLARLAWYNMVTQGIKTGMMPLNWEGMYVVSNLARALIKSA